MPPCAVPSARLVYPKGCYPAGVKKSFASRIIQWDTTLSGKDERCMQIKAGQKVIFSTTSAAAGAPADFVSHPVIAAGGDSPNPFSTFDEATGEVTFATAGEFGFNCSTHATGSMIGVILVQP